MKHQFDKLLADAAHALEAGVNDQILVLALNAEGVSIKGAEILVRWAKMLNKNKQNK